MLSVSAIVQFRQFSVVSVVLLLAVERDVSVPLMSNHTDTTLFSETAAYRLTLFDELNERSGNKCHVATSGCEVWKIILD